GRATFIPTERALCARNRLDERQHGRSLDPASRGRTGGWAHGPLSDGRLPDLLPDAAGLAGACHACRLPVPSLVTPTEAIEQLLEGTPLGRDQARQVMDQVMAGETTTGQLAGLLIALRAKGETVEEVTGFVDSMRAHATPT